MLKVDVSRVPEFLYAVITVLFVILFVVLLAVDPSPSRVPLPDLKIGKTNFRFYIMAIFTVILVACFFCAYVTYRLFVRKQKKI